MSRLVNELGGKLAAQVKKNTKVTKVSGKDFVNDTISTDVIIVMHIIFCSFGWSNTKGDIDAR